MTVTDDFPVRILSAEDHEHFIDHGYLVLKNMIDPEIVTAARAFLEEGSADYESIGSPIVKSCISPKVHQALAELLGGEYTFHKHQDIVSMPRPYLPDLATEAPDDSPVSQGGGHLDEDKPTIMPHTWALEVWVFLTPVHHRGGAFMFASGSPITLRSIMLRGYRAPVAGWVTDELFRTAAGGLPAEVDAREFLAAAGDVLVYPHLMAHCGSTNVADTTTRQAILARFRTTRRLIPGDRPFEKMSTIEKINSSSYLASRYGSGRFPVPKIAAGPESDGLLAAGYGAEHDITCHASLRFNGQTHLFFSGAKEDGLIRRVSTVNWIQWRETGLIRVPGPVCDLAVFHHLPGILLAVTYAGPDGRKVVLLRSDDLTRWEEFARPPLDVRCATPYYLTLADSRAAQGNLFFFIDDKRPATVQYLVGTDAYGLDWDEAADWTWRGVVAEADGPDRLAGMTIEPIEGETQHAMIATAETGDARTLLWSVSADSAHFTELRTLPSDVPGAYAVKVYDRALRYWMVTFLQCGNERTAVRWGTIDWAEDQPRLTGISDGRALRRALGTIGLL